MRLSRKSAPRSRRQSVDNTAERPGPSLRYYSRRNDKDLNTGRQLPREQRKPLPGSVRRFWLQRFGIIILLIALVACAVDVLQLSTHSSVQTVNNGPTLLHSVATYQAAADKLLANSIWNHNKITVNTARISRQLQHQFPELAKVSIAIPPLAHRPIIYIQPAQPALLLVSSNGTFLLDTTGAVVMSVPDPTKLADLNLPLVVDQSALQLTQGKQGLPSADVSFIQTIVAQLAAKSVNVSSLTLPAGTSEIDANISSQPYIVKFNLEHDSARQQAGTFLAAKGRLTSQHITPAHYIDVRVDGRAYYQ